MTWNSAQPEENVSVTCKFIGMIGQNKKMLKIKHTFITHVQLPKKRVFLKAYLYIMTVMTVKKQYSLEVLVGQEI